MSKIRIGLMSDLHLEMESKLNKNTVGNGHPDRGPILVSLKEQKPHLMLLGGDISLGIDNLKYAWNVQRYLGIPVVSIAGNHEGYGQEDFSCLLKSMQEISINVLDDLFFLENRSIRFLFDQRIIWILGATLWTDYCLNGSGKEQTHSMEAALEGLNDHNLICWQDQIFEPKHALEMHKQSKEWIYKEIERIRDQDGDEATIIVLTHHAPLRGTSDPQFHGSSLAPAFASDLSADILALQPDLWCYGHTHWNGDCFVGKTRVLSNQRGYAGKDLSYKGFIPKVIEI